jgi:hypothetical protein
MYNLASPGLDRSQRRTLQRRARSAAEAPAEHGGHDVIKALLRHFGLRTSLIRLKVMDALLAAHHEEREIGVRGVHSELEAQEVSASFLSVREVLKRLSTDGVIVLGDDKHYRLSAAAEALVNARA